MVRQAVRKTPTPSTPPATGPAGASGTMRDDAEALILCMGRNVLPFTRAQAVAERQGRHGSMFPAGYWAGLEREVRARIRRGLL